MKYAFFYEINILLEGIYSKFPFFKNQIIILEIKYYRVYFLLK